MKEHQDYIAAAETGDPQAQVWLGWAYLEGRYVDRDMDIAREWLEKAANRGGQNEKFRYAISLLSSQPALGVEYLQDLSSKNYPPASFELGNCYMVGKAISHDTDLAFQLWRKAADQGHILAKVRLIKADMQKAPFPYKILIYLKIIMILPAAIKTYWKDPNDPAILGSI